MNNRIVFCFFLMSLNCVAQQLDNGLSFIMRAKNEAATIRIALLSLLPFLEDKRTELIIIDNNSSDQTAAIVKEFQSENRCSYPCDHSHNWNNIKLYQYDKRVLKVGKETQEAVPDQDYATMTEYTNWCIDKATKKNIIKWDADFIAIPDSLAAMINHYKLLEREDAFALWFTGITLFVHNDQWFEKVPSWYDEFRVFSKYHGFTYQDSPDKKMETFHGPYFQKLTEIPTNADEQEFLLAKQSLIKNQAGQLQLQWLSVGAGFPSAIPGLREVHTSPVFYEFKRTDQDEFLTRSTLEDRRDQEDFSIIEQFKKNNTISDLVKPLRQNSFLIITPSYNCALWLEKCLHSLEQQTYKNYQVCVIDDASTDPKHTQIAQQYCEKNNWIFIKNNTNKGALYNIYYALKRIDPDDETIIITLDGDDWLTSSESLQILNLQYQDTTQLTYGRFLYYKNGQIGFSERYPTVIKNECRYRQYGWIASHLRTFKYRLWKNIQEDDLKNQAGQWFKVGWDMAFMFPMLEMAGDTVKFVNYPLCYYNIENQLNDFKLYEQEQKDVETLVRNKKSYPLLTKG